MLSRPQLSQKPALVTSTFKSSLQDYIQSLKDLHNWCSNLDVPLCEIVKRYFSSARICVIRLELHRMAKTLAPS